MAKVLEKVKNFVIVDEPTHEEEEADVWPSRLSFILASMGGAVGVGNLIRYPSIALRNYGLQWFIPYVGALFFVGLPILALEISIGQAFRSGNVLAFNRIHKRMRCVGLSAVFLGWIAATYYVVIMAWVMTYFRNSFRSPLPWAIDNEKFFNDNVIRNPAPVEPARGLVQYPARGVIWETFGWTVLTWLFVYFSLWKGVKTTGKVVYVTMLLPLVTAVAILIRAVTLKGAGRGIVLYVGRWYTKKLLSGKIWQDAVIQIFYSVGTGFGIFTAYASHNPRNANIIQDVTIIACGNSAIEMGAAFAAFGVIGFLGIDPDNLRTELTSFAVGFITYPTAIAKLPGANVWAVIFFLTLYLLGIDSAFAYIEPLTTAVANTNWGAKIRQTVAVFICCLSGFIVSIIYTTRFGYHMLNAMDTQVTGIALIMSVWAECVGSTSLYRHKDVIEQTGMPAFAVAQGSYFGSMLLGVLLGHLVKPHGPWIGLGLWLGTLIGGTIAAAFISKTPEIAGPWGQNKLISSLYWLTTYSGDQLRKDLNSIVAQGNNWSLPAFWSSLLRWLASPILFTILSLGYSDFVKEKSKDPLHIFCFVLAHFFVALLVVGTILPNALSIWVRDSDKNADEDQYLESPFVTIPPEKICPPPAQPKDDLEAPEKLGKDPDASDVDADLSG